MTAAGALLRRRGAADAAASRVALEAPHAVKAAVQHVSSLSGLNIWQRIIVVSLKVI